MSGSITVVGLEELRRKFDEFSDRRFAAAVATALTRTAVAMRQEMQREVLPQVFDRPTPFTLSSLLYTGASAQALVSAVGFRGEAGGAPRQLPHHIEGGGRRFKKVEAWLLNAGLMPQGWNAVPGQGARIDAFGNVSRSQVSDVMRQLQGQVAAVQTAARRKAVSAQRKAGGRFFVVMPGNRAGTQPGIYQREFLGRNVTPIFIYVRGVNYARRFDFAGEMQRRAAPRLQVEMERTFREHVERLAVATAGGGR